MTDITDLDAVLKIGRGRFLSGFGCFLLSLDFVLLSLGCVLLCSVERETQVVAAFFCVHGIRGGFTAAQNTVCDHLSAHC